MLPSPDDATQPAHVEERSPSLARPPVWLLQPGETNAMYMRRMLWGVGAAGRIARVVLLALCGGAVGLLWQSAQRDDLVFFGTLTLAPVLSLGVLLQALALDREALHARAEPHTGAATEAARATSAPSVGRMVRKRGAAFGAQVFAGVFFLIGSLSALITLVAWAIGIISALEHKWSWTADSGALGFGCWTAIVTVVLWWLGGRLWRHGARAMIHAGTEARLLRHKRTHHAIVGGLSMRSGERIGGGLTETARATGGLTDAAHALAQHEPVVLAVEGANKQQGEQAVQHVTSEVVS